MFDSFFVSVALVFVRHGFSFDFNFYFYFYFFSYIVDSFELFYTLVLALGGMTCVFMSFFFDLMSDFYMLCGVLAVYVIWLWLSDDSLYFYRFRILFNIYGPLVLAKNLSC